MNLLVQSISASSQQLFQDIRVWEWKCMEYESLKVPLSAIVILEYIPFSYPDLSYTQAFMLFQKEWLRKRKQELRIEKKNFQSPCFCISIYFKENKMSITSHWCSTTFQCFLVHCILKQIFTSVSMKVVDIYMLFPCGFSFFPCWWIIVHEWTVY